MQGLIGRFRSLPTWAKVVAVVVILGLLALLSPLAAALALLVFVISIAALVVQALRRRSLRTWGLTLAASFVAMMVFGGISAALFPTDTTDTSSSTGRNAGNRAVQEALTTSQETTKQKEIANKPETTARPEPEPEPEPQPESDPEPEPEPAPPPEPEPEPQPSPEELLAERGELVTVSRIVDGDTVEISPAVDNISTVRLIGVDTPEFSSDCGTQPLAQEATDFATARVLGEQVALEVGEESIDPFGRLLAYAWTGNESMFNTALLRQGYAQVYTVSPNDEYEARYFSAQQEAANAGRGIWGLSYQDQLLQNGRGNGVGGGCVAEPPPEPEPTPQPAPQPAPQPEPQPAPAPSGSQYPPFPGDPNGDLTCSDVPPGPYSVPPGSDRDRDGDGVACE